MQLFHYKLIKRSRIYCFYSDDFLWGIKKNCSCENVTYYGGCIFYEFHSLLRSRRGRRNKWNAEKLFDTNLVRFFFWLFCPELVYKSAWCMNDYFNRIGIINWNFNTQYLYIKNYVWSGIIVICTWGCSGTWLKCREDRGKVDFL